MSKDTICWDCSKSVSGGCPWMDRKEAFPGWKAVQTHHKWQKGAKYSSYCVSECPGFKRG